MKTKSITLAFLTLLCGSVSGIDIDITKRSSTDPLLVVKSNQGLLRENDPMFVQSKLKVKVSKKTGISAYKRIWGRNDVLMVHPLSEKQPGEIDFSKFTSASSGTIKIHIHKCPEGDHEVKLFKGGQEVESEEIIENKWINFSIDFDNESVALEVHATGWYYEHSFVTYKVTK